jgi:O-antigen/teichoic acid export membrane protein
LSSVRAYWNRIRTSRHLRSAGVLVGGVGVGQLVGLGTLLLVAILYQPVDLGVAQSVISVLGLLGVVCCGKLDQGLLVAPEARVLRILAAGAWLSALVALGVAVSLIFVAAMHGRLPGTYWVLAPASFLIGMSQLVAAVALRRRAFAQIARTRVEQSVMSSATTVGLGLLGFGALGLVLAQVVQHVGGTLRLWRRTAHEVTPEKLWAVRSDVPAALSENGHLLWGATSSGLVNNLAWSVPFLAVAYFYGAVEAGYFALAIKIVSPVRAFMTSTIYQISVGEGGQFVASGDHAGLRRQVLVFFKSSSLVAFGIVLLGLVGGLLAENFLNGKWAGVVPYIVPLVVLVSMQLAISPLTSLPILYSKQRDQFYFDLVRATLVCGLFLICGWIGIEARTVIISHVLIMAVTYAVYCRHFLSLLPLKAA